MNSMKLKELTLRNFKGIKNFTLVAGCVDTQVFGDNATGKTTIMDALSWLLFDKDSHGHKQFNIKTLDDMGVAATKLEHEVEGVLENGKPLTLKKIYAERWTGKRGSAAKELTGHTTKYYVNGEPVKKGEYQKRVADVATGEDTFQLLTNPNHFAGLNWAKQRELLIDVCGDISDEDVIASDSTLAELPGILGDHTCEAYKKIISEKRKKINEDLKVIPSRIDEQDRSKPDLLITNPETIISTLTSLNKELSKKNDEITSLKNGGGVAERKLKIAEINGSIQELCNKQSMSDGEEIQGLLKKRLTHQSKLSDMKSGTKRLVDGIYDLRDKIRILERENATLREEWTKVDNLIFIEKSCPTCGQYLPDDQIEAAKLKFNENKAKQLESINATGKDNVTEINRLKDSIKANDKKHNELCHKIVIEEKEVSLIDDKLETLNDNTDPSVEDSPEYKKLISKREAVEQEIADIEQGNSDAKAKLVTAKCEIEEKIKEQNSYLANIEAAHKANDRIQELKQQEKDLSVQLETLEKHLFLIESFIRAKVSMLEERINDKFDLVSFRLFKIQINEGLQETCEITVNGVPYQDLNSAARIQAGLDVIKTLSKYYNFYPCLFIDNAESVTQIPEMDAQVISLVVSESDKQLRVV